MIDSILMARTLDDILWYYGPEISAFAFNRNQIDVEIIGGEKTGDQPKVTISPVPFSELTSYVKTGGPELLQKSEDELVSVLPFGHKELDTTLYLSGAVAPKQKISLGLAVPATGNLGGVRD